MQRRETTGGETTKADTSKTEWRAFLLGVALLKSHHVFLLGQMD